MSLKVFTLIMLFIGFLYCVKIIYLLSDSLFLGLSLSGLFFSSTVILYYANLYLPDIHSFSLSIVGVYYFFMYLRTKESKHLFLLYCFVTLASLLKASFYYYECTFLVMVHLAQKREGLKFVKNWSLFLVSSIVVFSWYIYVKDYNLENNAWYYTTSPRPFWKYPKEKVIQALEFISGYWYTKYYFQSTFHFFLGVLIVGFFYGWRKKFNICLVLVLLFFNLIYLSLFLTQFIHHDYYFIVIVPSIIIAITLFFINIWDRFNGTVSRWVLKAIVLILTLLSLNYAKLNLHRRYVNSVDQYSIVRYELNGVNHFLDSLKVPMNSKFLVIGDKTQNGSLSFLNRFGWIYPNFDINFEKMSANIAVADYLVILKPSDNPVPIKIKSGLETCEKFVYYNNYIYCLKNYTK